MRFHDDSAFTPQTALSQGADFDLQATLSSGLAVASVDTKIVELSFHSACAPHAFHMSYDYLHCRTEL